MYLLPDFVKAKNQPMSDLLIQSRRIEGAQQVTLSFLPKLGENEVRN